MARRFWLAEHDIFRHHGLYHEPPPLQPEDVLAIAASGRQHPFRFHRNNESMDRRAADLPFTPGGELVMTHRAANVLLPVIEPWINVQRDVLVEGRPYHVLAIVTEVYDAMNEATSVGRRGPRSGVWLKVEQLHLIESRIGPSPIFRLPTHGIQWRYILAEPVVDAIRTHRLTGLRLTEAVIE